jgi:hypothetical protein
MTNAIVEDMTAYICERYPHRQELSDGRVTKMIYLADWKSALERHQQITNIQWTFNNYGPYVDDVIRTVSAAPAFEVMLGTNVFGRPKKTIQLREGYHYREGSLGREATEILDFVINTTKGLYWQGFIDLVYATYPIATQPRHTKLDLIALAREYSDYMRQFESEQQVL